MRRSSIKSCAAAPLPCRGGVGGGVSNFFVDKKIQTPPLPLPLRGGERRAPTLAEDSDFLKWTHLLTLPRIKSQCYDERPGDSLHGKLLSHKHSPTTIFFSTFNILLLNQLVEEFLNGSNTDACHFFHICQCKRRLCSHSIQYFSIVWCTESYPFTIIPPYILILFTHKEYIIINLSSYQFIKVFQEWFDILNTSMCTISW